MAEAWNLTPDGPVPCTTHVISRHVAMAVKCLYGETDALTLPRGWAKDNKEIFEGWFEKNKVNNLLKVELGLMDNEEI